MKCVVIGGAGFIGHHIAKKLLKLGFRVTVIDNLSTGKLENIPNECVFYKRDITIDPLEDILNKGDIVFLTAALARVQPSFDAPVDFNRVNVEGVLRVLEACRKKEVARVVYSSSSSVYGDAITFPTPETANINPMSPYALQKYVGELYCQLYSKVYKLDTVCLRYFNVYGPGMPLEGAYRTVISIFGECYKNGNPLPFTNDGQQRRDFTHVFDVADANIAAGMSSKSFDGTVFNVGNGFNYSINEIIDMFGLPGVFYERRFEPLMTLADNSKIKQELNWQPQNSLPDFIAEYKQYLKEL